MKLVLLKHLVILVYFISVYHDKDLNHLKTFYGKLLNTPLEMKGDAKTVVSLLGRKKYFSSRAGKQTVKKSQNWSN